MEPYKIELKAYNSVIKTVGSGSDKIGTIYVPKSWSGRKTIVVLLEEEKED